LVIADSTAHGKIQIEGQAAYAVVQAALGRAPDKISAGLNVAAGRIFRLRPDQFFLLTPPGREAEALHRLQAAVEPSGAFVTITDVTHGLADIRVMGPHTRALLRRVCALDVSERALADMTAAQTSVAKTKQMLIRRDFGSVLAFQFLGAQSLGVYLWEVLMEAGREFGIQPIGVRALGQLERS
jgi:heterotetrameric sarcosine oxidase gamma subunit